MVRIGDEMKKTDIDEAIELVLASSVYPREFVRKYKFVN